MKPILFLFIFTVAVSAQDNWRQSRDYLGNNIKLIPLVQNPSYVPQSLNNQNQRIGRVNNWAQTTGLENVFNPNQYQRVPTLKTWIPPTRLKNVDNPTNQNQKTPLNWNPLNQGNSFNRQQATSYIPQQQQFINSANSQRSYTTVTQQPISITYSPLQKQDVPKYQQKKQQSSKKQELKKKHTPKKIVYQPQVVYDPFAQDSNQQIQPLPYIPPNPQKQSYQGSPLDHAQNSNNIKKQSYPRNPVTYRYNKKQLDPHRTQAAQPSVRSSKVINHVSKQPKGHLLKDYRDDKTHEPQADDIHYERDEQEYDREEAEDEPGHEEYEVPTKPIYPGEGQWAIRGRKHRPFIRGDKPVNLDEDDDEVPDGYETFVQGQKVFDKTKADLSKQFDQVPKQHGLGKYISEKEEEEEDTKEDQFVPVRLYAQVRHSEDEKHLPRSAADDERLKELVKDSKIHTVYSEEGYEDDAYDHAGHEKNAETGEAFEEAGKLHDRKIVKKIPDKILEQAKVNNDAVNAGSSDSSLSATHESKSPSNNTLKSDYLSTKQSKVMTSKEANDGSKKMEVEGKIKVIMKPENATKVKQHSKPLPKVHKILKPKHDSEGKASLIEEKVLKKKFGKVRPTTATVLGTTATTEEIGDILTEDIPATTLGTTAMPKKRNEITVATILTLGKEEQPFSEVGQRNRRKRGAFDGQKYPYYRTNVLNPNSPLRYSEDLSNIPDKTRDNLAFYRQAETRFRCPEIDRTVDPIPEQVKDKVASEGQEEDDEADEEETDPSNHKPPSKRLNQLGDKIDCLKVKYFGVNPFDSPFFEEAEVGPVKPVLNFNDKLSMSVSSPPAAFPKEPYIKEQMRHQPVIATILPIKYHEEPYTNEQLREQFIKKQLEHFPLVLPTAAPKEQYTEEQLRDLQNQYSKEQLRQLQEEYLKAELKKLDVPYMEDEFDHIESPHVIKQSTNYDNLHKEEHSEQSTTPRGKPKASQTSANTISLRKVKINPKIALHSTSEDIYNDDETIEENEVFSASEPRENVIQIGAKESKDNSKGYTRKKLTPLEATTESVSLLTTPKYTIDLKPKHIYHQIELLGYLPGDEDIKQNATSRMDQVVENPNEPKTNESVRVVITLDENKRKPKILIEEIAPKFAVAPGNGGVGRAQAVRRIRIKQKNRPSSSRAQAPKSVPSRIVIPLHGSEQSTETPEYRPSLSYTSRYSTQRPYAGSNPYSSNYQQASFQDRIKVRIVRPNFQIFDINKFLPTTETSLFADLDMFGESSAPLPKYKIVSEVYYKDDIKPNEQLMLLADVMNHIRNSSRQEAGDTSKDSSETIPVTLKNISKNKAVKQQVDRGFYEVNTPVDTTSMPTSTTTTLKPVRKEIDESYVKRPRIRRVKYRKKKLKPTTPTTTTMKLPEEITEAITTTEVANLKPPAIETHNLNKMNKYYVQGMRPPPRQKLFMYSDYLKNELNRNRQRLHRSRRSAAKYAELSRSRVGGAATTSQPEIDDYVPNRTRNWHYDDKTGKIVYHNVPKPEEDKEVEVIYEEVTEPVIPLETMKPKQNPIFATATPPPEGQSYIDFVNKLKNDSNYKPIPDPTTTEKSNITENVVSTTLKPLSTTPPEFLSILSKVKSNSGYKHIEDESDKKKTTTTTETTEPESLESQEEGVQNSPGGIGMNSFQIFDITDYIPKIKHYLPVTGVDTSKYTTIQRPKTDTSKAEEEKNSDKLEDIVKASQSVTLTGEKDNSTRSAQAHIGEVVDPTSTITSTITTTTTTPHSITVTADSGQIIDEMDSTTGSSDSSRRRRRRKRRRKIVGQGNNSTSLSTEPHKHVSSEEPNSNNRRRRVQTSTEKFLFDNVDDVTKSVVRRSDNSDPRFQRLYEIEQPSANKVESKREDASSKKDDAGKENMYVVVFQPYDPNSKTGGDYMKEPLTGESVAEKPRHKANEKLVEVFQPYDPNQKTGGNYKAAPASNITENITVSSPNSRKYVEVFQQYDPEKKTGGNYRAAESYNTQNTETVDDPKKYVDVFQHYDPNEKTGGNYKSKDKEKLVVEDTTDPVLEVTQPINSNRKTDKNYAADNLSEEEKLTPADDLVKAIDVFHPYDPNQKHGGNYKHDPNKTEVRSASNINTEEVGTLEEPIAAENQHSAPKEYKEAVAVTKTTEGPLVINLLSNFDKPDELKDRSFDLKNKKKKNKKTTKTKSSVTRLADVVPKPETYYTDPNLPKAVNMLMEVNLPNEEIEKIVEGKDGSEETAPKKQPTKAQLSRAKVARKSYKNAKEIATPTTTIKPEKYQEGYQVTEETTIEDNQGRDPFEERKEAEESRTVTEKQRIEDRQERSEPDVEETDIEEPYEEVHHQPGNANENKSSFKEEYIPLDDDHDHHHEDEVEDLTSEDEEASATEKLTNLPPIIKDPSKRFYYYLPA